VEALAATARAGGLAMDNEAGTPTGVVPRERARETGLGAVAANGAGEVRPQLLDQSINHYSYRLLLQVLMFFFTCQEMGLCPNLWTVFFVFYPGKEEIRGFYFSDEKVFTLSDHDPFKLLRLWLSFFHFFFIFVLLCLFSLTRVKLILKTVWNYNK
jgi:hypothetical protein